MGKAKGRQPFWYGLHFTHKLFGALIATRRIHVTKVTSIFHAKEDHSKMNQQLLHLVFHSCLHHMMHILSTSLLLLLSPKKNKNATTFVLLSVPSSPPGGDLCFVSLTLFSRRRRFSNFAQATSTCSATSSHYMFYDCPSRAFFFLTWDIVFHQRNSHQQSSHELLVENLRQSYISISTEHLSTSSKADAAS